MIRRKQQRSHGREEIGTVFRSGVPRENNNDEEEDDDSDEVGVREEDDREEESNEDNME